jgi:threonyl-tRNA synthetase
VSSDQVSITLPDGSSREYPAGVTIRQVAESIGKRLGRDAIGGVLDSSQDVIDVHTPITGDAAVRIVTLKSPEGLVVLRHSASHVMASAVQRLFPGTQVTFGPAVENGFYYDFKRDEGFTPDDLATIEKEMAKVIAADLPLERSEVSRSEAKKLFTELGEDFKVEHIDDIPEGEVVTLYRHGDWVDLCKGPHVPSTGAIKAFKLTSVAGAYWKGDPENPMLSRIYGTAFWDQKGLDEHLERLEEAKRRDHRRIGKELDLFHFDPIAPAMPFFHGKGAVIYNTLVELVRKYYKVLDFDEVITPQVVDVELFKRSGHYDNYQEDMFFSELDNRQYGVKPMNCPGHTLIYSASKRSYRDLPVRLADFGRLHRYELSGVTSGLTRVRSFSQDDAHIFCREDQIASEINAQIAMVQDLMGHFGFDMKVGFSTRPEQSIGREPGLSDAERAEWDALWSGAEEHLRGVLDASDLEYEQFPGDGAFYGPKIDFHARDALARWHQLGTIQLDFAMPKRFGLSYTNEESGESPPVMIHRAILGSFERFIGILIEHTAGDFPVWLAPVQVRVISVNDELLEYAEAVAGAFRAADLRVRVDHRSEKLGFKIRDAELNKVPIVLVVGNKERQAGTVSVRWRKKGDLGTMAVDEAVASVLKAAAIPSPGEKLMGRGERVFRL